MANNERIIIPGPCSVESREQFLTSVSVFKEMGIDTVRGTVYKPRTRPGEFEGVKLKGVPWIAEATNLGITVGTEVLMSQNVTSLIKCLDKNGGDPTKLLFWLGSRNQNQDVQRGIARRISKEAPNNVKLLIKNQPWNDEAHWLGIVDYVVSAGLDPSRLILCHRGFCANGHGNPHNFRNIPDFDMAMRVKEKTGLPMLLDPSHIGGSVENVFKVVGMAAEYPFDGMIIEVHPDPPHAKTDNKQQLTFQQFYEMLKLYKNI